MNLWPFSRSGVKTFNEARKQWRWCSIGRRRHLSRRSIPGGSHADVSLMHEPLEVRKLLAISAGYDGNDLAITADAEGDAITLEFDGAIVKIYDASGLYDTYTTSGFSGNITASSTDANLNTSFTFAFDQTALSRALQIDASISNTAIGSAIESTSSADISFGGLTTIAADISTPASINFGGDVVIFDDITLTATDVIVSGNVEAAVSAFGMDDIGITWQETTAATTSSTALVTPAGGSPEVWAAAVGYGGGIERFDPADGSSLGSLGYDVGTSGQENFNLIPCPTGEYVYGVHYTPYTSGGGGYKNPGKIFQYATDGSGYATFFLGQYEYDYRGYQCLTIADDGAYILLSQGEKIFKIDTSTAWGESDNQDRIQHTWNLPDSKGDNRYAEQLRVNSIAILPDGSRAYAAMNYNNAIASGDITNKSPANAFAVLNLQTLAQPTITQLQGTGDPNIQPNWVAAAPDSSAVYVANRRLGTDFIGTDFIWRVGTNGSQTYLWKSGEAYTNAVLSGDGSRFFTTNKGGNGTYFEVYDTTNGSISKITYTYVYIDGDAQIPNSSSHGFNQPSLVVSNDGSYGAVATTNNEVVILDWSDTDGPIVVDRVQVDHTISSIELVETDTNSAIYVGGSNKVTKIFIAGDPEDGNLPPLPETSTLVVNASNLSHFGGSIGATNPLTGLVTDAPGVTVLSGNVTTTGDHTFLDPVQLQADVDLLGTGFSALKAGATGSFHLNAFADSGTRIEGVSNLSSFATNTTISINGTINTTGQQQYDDGIQLLGATTLGGGSAVLNGTIEGDNQNLTLDFSAETTINNPGDSNRIANFVSNGPIALQGTISTTGSQTYSSTLTLADDATIVAQSTNLTGGIAGNQKNLTLNVQNETLIDGTSVFDNLASIESIGPVSLNATVVTSGNQNYSGTVTLVGDTTLVADGGEFSREIIGNGQDLTLTINNTITIEDGSGVNNLTSSGDTVLTGTINTTGSQTYQSNVTIEGDVTINAGGEVLFEADVIGDDEITYSSWATQAGGTSNDNGKGVSVLADGSSIVTGQFEGTATFGSTTLTSAGGSDAFIAKLDASGTYEWATQAGGTSNDSGYGVSVLADGSSIVTGIFQDTATFGSTTLTSAGSNDVFVAKLDASGTYEWVKQAGGTRNDNARGVSVLADGSSIVTGYFQGTATFGSTTFTSAGGSDVFVAKLDADGVYQWATRAGGTSGDSGENIAVLADGSSIVTGYFQGTATFGSTTLTSAGNYDVFVAKIDASGTYEWATQAGGTGHDYGYGVSVLADGSSIVTGYFQGTATFGSTTLTSAGSKDVFVAKLDASGNYEWAKQAGGTSSDLGYGVSVLADGSSIVTGFFEGTATFGSTTFTSAGSNDVFVAKLDASGNFDGIVIPDDADLTINTQADTTFGGTVSNLATLTTDAGGSTIAKADITTTGNQTYNDQFVLNTSLTLTGGNASFTGGLDGNGNDLTLNFSSATTIDGNNDFSDLGSLRSIGDVNLNGTIVTANVQTYEANMTLIGTTVLQGQQGIINGTLVGDGNDLTLNFTTETAIAGDGNGINNLTVVGPALLGASVTTIGSQEYQSPVTLSAATVLTGTNGTFTGALNGNENDLTLHFSDTTTIDGNNVFSNLGNLTSHGDVNLTGTIVTEGVQTYEANMTLIGPTVLQGEQGVINGSLIGDNNDLTLNFTTETAIAGDGNGINNLTVVGPALLGASVTTIGSQEYQSPVTLSAATTLTGTSGTFAGGLDGNENDLTLHFSNVTTIDGSSTFSHLDNLVSKGDVVLNSTISTSGSQTYEKNVSLSGATILVGQNGTFGGSVEGNNNDLTLNFSDTTTITGSQLQNIHNLSVGGGGSIETSEVVSTTGSQQYLDDIVLTGDTALLSGSATISTQAITDNAADHTLTLGDAGQSGDIVLDGNISIGSLAVGAGTFNIRITGTDNTFNGTADFKNTGTISLGNEETDTTLFALGLNTTNGSSTNTGGTILTRGADVVINQINQLANTTIDTTAGNNPSGAQIRLLDGVELNGQELTTDGGTTGSTRVAGDSTIDDGKVIVEEGDLDIGEETLPGNLTLTRDTIFRMDGGGSINIKPNSSIAAATHSLTMVTNELNVDPTAGDITAENITITPQNKSLDIVLGTATGNGLGLGAAAFGHFDSPNIVIGETGYAGTIHVGNLTVSTGQLTLIADGTGGAINISEGLNLTDSKDGLSLYIRGSGATTDLNGTIQTAGAAYIEDAIRLIGDASIETTGGDLTITGGTEGIFSQAGSNFNLSIDAGTGTVALGSLAGFGNGNGTGSLLQDASVTGASIELFATSDSVAGNLSFNGPVSIVGPTPRSLTMSAGNINFQSTVDATSSDFSDLILNSQGTTSFSGSIGATHQLGSLTTDAGGTTNINGGSVNTVGSQSFGDAVVLGSDATLTSLNSDIVFSGTVDSDSTARTLALSSGSTIAFSDAVGATNPLASLTSAATGQTTVANNVTITGLQNYSTPVTLLNDVTFQGGEGQFTGGLDGSQQDLTLNFTAPVTINGSETFGNIGNLSVQNAANLSGTINTTGFQNYGGAVTLVGDTTLQGTFGEFLSGMDGQANNLQLEFSSETEINGSTAFANIGDLSSTGPVRLRGAISTSGFQNYGNTTTLFGDTTLNTGGSGNVSFGNTVDGSHDLAIEAGTGRVDFFGALGASAPLQSLNLASAAAVQANSTLAIDGTGGSGPGLRVGPNVDNLNIAQPGSAISNANQDGILFAGGSANSIVGGFTITNSGESGVSALSGDYTNSAFTNSTVTGSTMDGFAATETDGFSVTNSEFTTNGRHGIHFDATLNSTAGNNTVGNNAQYGVLVVSSDSAGSTVNATISGNFIGTKSIGINTPAVMPNGRSGIWVLGNAEGHGTVDTVSITGNTIANNAVHGIEVWSATNVTIGGTRGESTENIITNNTQYGIAFTDDVFGSVVQGNTLAGNTQAGLYLNSAQNLTVGGGVDGNGSLDISSSDFGVVAGGTLTDTQLSGNNIHDNMKAGIQLLAGAGLSLFRNTIQNNGDYGLLAVGQSTGTEVLGNTIKKQDAGIWLAGASGMSLGSILGDENEQNEGITNKVKENNWVGIVIQGAESTNNTILSNAISSNIYYGIQFVDGATGVAIPSLTSATTNRITGTVTGNAGDVYRIQYFKTSSESAANGLYAQGDTYIGYQDVTIGGSSATLDFDLSAKGIIAGDVITATATLLSSGTPSQSSSFSNGIRVT